ncbi:MAG: T9SS type A sorting domain-containing protein [Chitinophagaceae bacterium]
MFSADQTGAYTLAKGTSLFTDSGPATIAGGKMYFTAYNPANGRELWSYDGDTAVRLTDIAPGAASGLGNSFASGPTLYNDSLYFPGGTDGINYQLYAYNLVTSVTSLVNNVHVGDTLGKGNNILSSELTVYNKELFFTAYEPATGCELWHYDGTKTSLYADICAGTDSGFVTRENYSYGQRITPTFTEYNGHLYFRARDKAHGTELWRIGDLPSGVQAINWSGSAVFRPNPANSFAAIDLNLTQAQDIAISLSDMTGRVVQRKAVTSYSAGKHTIKLDLNQLSAGQYLYRVLDAGGTQLSTGTFVKE